MWFQSRSLSKSLSLGLRGIVGERDTSGSTRRFIYNTVYCVCICPTVRLSKPTSYHANLTNTLFNRFSTEMPSRFSGCRLQMEAGDNGREEDRDHDSRCSMSANASDVCRNEAINITETHFKHYANILRICIFMGVSTGVEQCGAATLFMFSEAVAFSLR